jgi:hypothetical protein
MKFLKSLVVPAILGLGLMVGCKEPAPVVDNTPPVKAAEPKFETPPKGKGGEMAIPANTALEGAGGLKDVEK